MLKHLNGCGSIWTVVEVYELLWKYTICCGSVWTVVKAYELLWKYMNCCETIWTVVEVYELLWKYMNCCGSIWTVVEVYELLWKHMNCCGSTQIFLKPYNAIGYYSCWILLFKVGNSIISQIWGVQIPSFILHVNVYIWFVTCTMRYFNSRILLLCFEPRLLHTCSYYVIVLVIRILFMYNNTISRRVLYYCFYFLNSWS